MKQCYKPVIFTKGEDNKIDIIAFGDCYKYNNGAKLMEHSYLHNRFVSSVCRFIAKNGIVCVTWAGDYADPHESETRCLYELAEGYDTIAEDSSPINYDRNTGFRFLINHTKREYVDMWDYQFNPLVTMTKMVIHPLPLLTCEGNGRGGGDYEGLNMELVGSWAGDEICFSDEVPEDYFNIDPVFVEGYDITRITRNLVDLIKYTAEQDPAHFRTSYLEEALEALKNGLKEVNKIVE